MFKKTMLSIAVTGLSLVLFAGTVSAASMVKVAVVDLQSALNATSEGLAAKDVLSKKHQANQEQVDKMKAELDTMEEKIKSPVISEAAQADLKEQYRQKKNKLIEFATRAKQDEDQENQKLTTKILDGLLKITREIGKEEGYTLILEKSGAAVVYFEANMDITDRVVKIYNERYQAGAGK